MENRRNRTNFLFVFSLVFRAVLIVVLHFNCWMLHGSVLLLLSMYLSRLFVDTFYFPFLFPFSSFYAVLYLCTLLLSCSILAFFLSSFMLSFMFLIAFYFFTEGPGYRWHTGEQRTRGERECECLVEEENRKERKRLRTEETWSKWVKGQHIVVWVEGVERGKLEGWLWWRD